jgi:hypothetical protein
VAGGIVAVGTVFTDEALALLPEAAPASSRSAPRRTGESARARQF